MFAISGPHYKCCKCQNKIPKTDIEEIFHQQLTNYIISNDKLEDYINASKSIIIKKENHLKILQKEALQIQSKMDNLLDLHLIEEIPTDGFKHHHNPLYEQLKQIEVQTPIIEGEILALKQNEENGKFMFKEAKTLYDQWETFSKNEKRNIVESITDSIIVNKEGITLNLKYLVPPFPNKPPGWETQRQCCGVCESRDK